MSLPCLWSCGHGTTAIDDRPPDIDHKRATQPPSRKTSSHIRSLGCLEDETNDARTIDQIRGPFLTSGVARGRKRTERRETHKLGVHRPFAKCTAPGLSSS